MNKINLNYRNNLFIILSVLYLFIIFTTDKIIYIQKFLIYSYDNKITFDQIEKNLNFKKKWEWVSYVFIPLLLLIKTTLIASVLYIDTYFYSKITVTFKQLWHIVVKAEFVFLGVGVLKIIWFYFFQTTYTLTDLQFFYPLSALNIIGYQGLDVWFIYPLQVLNLFELAYWLLLAYYIGKITSPTKNIDYNTYKTDFGLKIVATSYGSALILWVAVVMFFTLNYS